MKSDHPAVLRTYTRCWLHTNVEDHYAGIIETAHFSGNRLNLLLSKMVTIQLTDTTGIHWMAFGKVFVNYRFEFEGCNITKHGDRYVELKSVTNDTIILSSNTIDEEKINKLISEVE